MKYVFTIIFVAIILTFNSANGKSLYTNNVDDIEISFKNIGVYMKDLRKQRCIKYEISNNSDNDYLLWIEHVDSLNQYCDSVRYFKKKVGMFSLMNIVNEYGSTLQLDNFETFPQLYTTFFKVISPCETFCVYILCSNSISEDLIIDSIKLLQLNYSEVFNSSNKDIFKMLSYNYDNFIFSVE